MQDDSLRQLQEYITQALAHGQTQEHIYNSLQHAGWPHEYIARAFVFEQTTPMPPAPIHTKTDFKVATLIQTPLGQDLAIAFILGIVNMAIFLVSLPSQAKQIVNNIVSLYSGATIDPVVYQILITTFVLGVITSLVLTFKFKRKAYVISPVLVSFMAVFLSLIAAQERLVGTRFSLSLLVTFPLAQALWYYGRRRLTGRVIYTIAIVVFFVVSVRVLNTGSI